MMSTTMMTSMKIDNYFDNDNEDSNDNGDKKIRGETSFTSKIVSYH